MASLDVLAYAQQVAKRLVRKPDPMPDDVLGIQSWAYRQVAMQMQSVLSDRSLSIDKRRELVLKHAQTLVPLIPKAAVHAAVDALRGESDDMSNAARGPEMEDASQFSRPSGAATAKRGRPRKRSLL